MVAFGATDQTIFLTNLPEHVSPVAADDTSPNAGYSNADFIRLISGVLWKIQILGFFDPNRGYRLRAIVR